MSRPWALIAGLALVLAGPVGVLTSPAGLAEDERGAIAWMSGEAIRESFSGKALSGIYPNHESWNEQIFADGTTDYREAQKRWRGSWWVDDRAFCFSYPPPGIGGCFRVARMSRNCFELYETTGPEGRGDEPPLVPGSWNGRMWLTAEPPTCDERPLS